MAKNITLADIAKKVGVSTVSVSKALSDKPGVREELRIQIKEVADEMGYVPSASSKSSFTTGNIGVLISENYYGYASSFYISLYEQVVKELFQNHYYGILELLSPKDEKNKILPKVLQEEKVDGIILIGEIDEEYTKNIMSKMNIPILFLDTYSSEENLDSIISDGYYGMYRLVMYLIKIGHRRISFVGDITSTKSIADRFWGYRRALQENQIQFDPSWLISDRSKNNEMYEQIICEKNTMDAYACNCDLAAYVVLKNLEEQDLSVPEDVSIVGFDNFLPAGIDGNFITTYEVDKKKMAKVCVSSLINKIKKSFYLDGIQVVSGNIIFKNSVLSK